LFIPVAFFTASTAPCALACACCPAYKQQNKALILKGPFYENKSINLMVLW